MCPYLLEIYTYAYIDIFINKSDDVQELFQNSLEKGTESFGIGEIKLATY